MGVNTKTILELRKITGAGVTDCQEALEASENDIEKAIEYLRKKGSLKAAKKADRETHEGVISIAMASDASRAVMVQVHCETDFVAKNSSFMEFVKGIADTALTKNAKPEDLFAAQKESIVLKTGENIVFGRSTELIGALVTGYVHSNNKVGVLVAFSEKIDADSAKDIAMHIAAASPTYVESKDIPADILEKEKEIYREQLRAEKKPENMLEKILGGKLQKFYEETCLLNQAFVKDDSITIQKFLGNLSNTVKVTGFIRYQLG